MESAFIPFESYDQVIAAARAAQSGRLREYLSDNGLTGRSGGALGYSCPDNRPAKNTPYSVPEVSIDGGIVRHGRTPPDDDEAPRFCGLCVTKP